MKNKTRVFCNNKICPYIDCELKLRNANQQMNFTVLDLQSSCKRLAEYIAKQINKHGCGNYP